MARESKRGDIAAVSEPAPKKKKGSAWPLYVVLLAVPGMIITTIVLSVDVQGSADDYVAYVQDGKLDEAYAMLLPEVRARISREAFETELSTAELARASEPTWNHTSSGDGRACVEGRLEVDGERRRVLIYLRDEGDGYQVEMVYVYTGVRPTEPYRCNTG